MFNYKIIIFLSVISSLLLAINCDNNWCPCFETTHNSHQNISKHAITDRECQKYKGFYVSEERDFKCVCCLLLRKNKDSCKPAKNHKFVVKCEEGLHCDHRHVCRGTEKKNSIVVVLKGPQSHHSNDDISGSFKRSFAEMLRNMFGCDCSHAKCNNEITRMECEEHQGLFVDKQSVRNRCQCCDKCYIPKGQHQKCAHSYNKDIMFVCDSGLYCSPFTHMCIEKGEIFSQFMRKVEMENINKERVGVFEQDDDEPDHIPQHNVLILHREKRDDHSTEHSTTEGEHGSSTTEGPGKGKGKKDHPHGPKGKHGKGHGKHGNKHEGDEEHKEGGKVGARHGKHKGHKGGKGRKLDMDDMKSLDENSTPGAPGKPSTTKKPGKKG